jgi:remodeling and spacing factor 1
LLLTNLQNNLREYDRALKRRENEELRRKRLAYVGISLDNVLPNKEKEAGASGKYVVWVQI